MQTGYHITFGGHRTTVSVDKILSEMLAIQLGCTPGTREAHAVVREWLQETLVSKLGESAGRKSASQWARRYAIEAIADKSLSKKWEDWTLEQ